MSTELAETAAVCPVHHEQESDLHARTLSRVVTIAGTVAGVLCLIDGWLVSTLRPSTALLILCLACLVAHRVNRAGRYYLACGLFVGAALSMVTYIMVVGDGLRDSGLLAIPPIIVAGTMLFGRRAAWPLFALGLLSVAITAIFGDPAVVAGEERLTVRLVSVIAILAATTAFMRVVIDDADRHRTRVEQSQRELHRAYDMTLEGWAKILEYRDEETEGHSRRVADLAVALARDLGMDELQVLQVRRGALLHDIGKLGIPDHILLKPGPLDRQERAIMEQHPTIARAMLTPIPFLEPALAIPYSHHERWDGRGYPQGLAGEQIPFAARLFAVVDQWEALTSDRPYRAAWPSEEALAYIRTNAGSIFDPEIVTVFVRLLDRLAAIPTGAARAG